MTLFAAFVVLIVAALYWMRYRVWSNSANSKSLAVILLLMLVLLMYANKADRELLQGGAPTLIAIASDVSLSMGTVPDPRVDNTAGTRLKRVRQVLLPVLIEMDASTRPVMVSVIAFTSKSETVLAWDDNLPQVREVIEYVLEPGLLTEPGTDLGAALSGVVPLFESLPENYRGQEQEKFLVIVSDGEQTVDQANVDMAMSELRTLGVKIISLHVGMSDLPEGLPVYDDLGNFIGFDEIGGQIYSVPNPEIMTLLAGPDPANGMFVKAESSDAVAEIIDFIGVPLSNAISGPMYLTIVLALWGLTMTVLFRLS